MKKMLAVIMIVVFSFHISMLSLMAAGETITQDSGEKSSNITVGYDAGVSYTVTIPANVTFTDTEKSVERGLQVSNVVLDEGSTLSINITSLNNFRMVNGEGYIEYSLLANNNETPKENNYIILTVLAGERSGWVILDFITELNKDHVFYAGKYTDTLTFTVTVN